VTYLIRNGWRKWILRKAVEDILPDDVVWRKKKMGFPFPYERFRRESNSIMEMILDRANNPLLDLSQRESLKSNWKAMSFILWYELYFNENSDLLVDIQTTALNLTPASDTPRPLGEGKGEGPTFVPEYLRNGSAANGDVSHRYKQAVASLRA
jgi:hypothetical protein